MYFPADNQHNKLFKVQHKPVVAARCTAQDTAKKKLVENFMGGIWKPWRKIKCHFSRRIVTCTQNNAMVSNFRTFSRR